jgi:hypothetical protein
MNGRISLVWPSVFLWFLVAINMSQSLVETIIGGLFVVFVVWLFSYIGNAYRGRSQDSLFDLSFVDHDPPGSTEINRYGFHPIPLGHSQQWVKVITAEGFGLADINVRCISVEEAAKKPDANSPEDIRTIISITQVNITPEIIAQGVTAIQTDDRHGGIDVKLAPPYAWGTRRAIFLKIDIDAKQVWSGKISFRGYDKDQHPRYARADVRVIDEVKDATIESLQNL